MNAAKPSAKRVDHAGGAAAFIAKTDHVALHDRRLWDLRKKRDAQAEFIAQAVGDTKVGRKKSRIQRHSRLLKARQQR